MKKEELDKILELHRLYLIEDEEGKCAKLRNANLLGADLRGANLRRADLRNADLEGVNLRRADLRNADLEGANLRRADLRNADLEDANLVKADLRSADLISADLRSANLGSANLDFSVWPLWCGTAHSDIKVDKKIAAQLLYHACIVAQQHLKIPKTILNFVKKNFHRFKETEKLKGEL